jgi:3',5'-cyclic AMP phosphodiesterase CpdA
MIIVQISDTHIQSANPDAAVRLRALERTVASINALPERPLAVLHTGDVAHDATAEDYAEARNALKALQSPVLAIMGNRDRRGPFREAFAGEGYIDVGSPFIQYAVELGGLRLVALDTFDDESGIGHYCEERDGELARMLHGGSMPTLVLLHHPPVPLPDVPGKPLQWRDHDRAALVADRLANAPGVVGIVAGHVHRAQTATLVGKDGPAGARRTPLTTMPSIAPDLRRERLIAKTDERPVYHIHRLAEGSITTASIMVG